MQRNLTLYERLYIVAMKGEMSIELFAWDKQVKKCKRMDLL